MPAPSTARAHFHVTIVNDYNSYLLIRSVRCKENFDVLRSSNVRSVDGLDDTQCHEDAARQGRALAERRHVQTGSGACG